MTIRQFTIYPQRTDSPDDFADNGDTWIRELSTQFIPDANDLADDVNSNAAIATTQAGIATTQAGIAAEQVALATTQAGLAAEQVSLAAEQVALVNSVVGFKGVWNTLTGSLSLPASVLWVNLNWRLLENVADVTLHEPGVSDKWRVIREPMTTAEVYYLGSM